MCFVETSQRVGLPTHISTCQDVQRHTEKNTGSLKEGFPLYGF